MSANDNSQVIADLRAARQVVAAGWCQGKLSDTQGHVCAMGALARVTGLEHSASCDLRSEQWRRHRQGHAKLQIHIPPGFEEVAAYNDADTTTQQDILNLFDKALADLGGLA